GGARQPGAGQVRIHCRQRRQSAGAGRHRPGGGGAHDRDGRPLRDRRPGRVAAARRLRAVSRRVRPSRVAAGAAVVAGVAVAALRRATRGRPGWSRANFRGTPVSLAGGPGVAAAASLAAAAGAASPATAAATLAAGLGAGGFGLYDDLVGMRPEHRAKGFHGHLAALRRGRVTSGVTKILGIGAASLAASVLLPRPARGSADWSRRRSLAHTLVGAGVIAGAANLFNLLDLRPGRALK